MIDWIHARLEVPEPLDLPQDRLVRITADGEVLWESFRPLVASSGDSSVMVRDMGSTVVVSGNPAKWFQGHNLWGPDHLPSVLFPWVRSVLEALEAPRASLEAAWALWTGRGGRPAAVDLVVVHAAVMFDLGSDEAVKAFISFLEGAPARNRRVRGNLWGSSTVEWTTRSLRMKAYHKREELQRSGPDSRVVDHWEDLLAWASGKLRWEVELRSRELKRLGLRSLDMWDGVAATSAALSYTDLVEMPDKDATPVLQLEQYPKHLRKTVALWKSGFDVRAFLSRPTFYRHRKELLDYGIDIAQPYNPDGYQELPVIRGRPGFRFRDLPIATPPDWARGTPLMWEPEPVRRLPLAEA